MGKTETKLYSVKIKSSMAGFKNKYFKGFVQAVTPNDASETAQVLVVEVMRNLAKSQLTGNLPDDVTPSVEISDVVLIKADFMLCSQKASAYNKGRGKA